MAPARFPASGGMAGDGAASGRAAALAMGGIMKAIGGPGTADRPATPRDTLGCSLSALGRHQELAGQGFVLYRKSHGATAESRVETPPSARGLLVGIALAPGHRRRIFDGRGWTSHAFAEGSCYIRSFCDAYRADMESGFDFFLLELSQAELSRSMEEAELPPAEGLARVVGETDPALAHLAGALLPALAASGQSTPLYVDQVVCAMQTHLAARYHGGQARLPRGLTKVQLTRGKELLAAALDGHILIGDIAAACGVSRSHFIRGFREATGTTPYQWLLARRIERARALMVDSRLSLADVAVACGFSDQSHMTRTFRRLTGAAPGAWRRGQ